MLELLQNVQKFHPNQSPNVEISLSHTSNTLCIQAPDGQTYSADQTAHLWYPYYQAERGFSGQVPGMGLGLSTVASFIWNVGGTCRAHNRADGAGVIVELVLPMFENTEGEAAKQSTQVVAA